jgi:hypothetical protein
MAELSSKPRSAREDSVLALAALSESSSPACDPFFLDPFSAGGIQKSVAWYWTRIPESSEVQPAYFCPFLKLPTSNCSKSAKSCAPTQTLTKLDRKL